MDDKVKLRYSNNFSHRKKQGCNLSFAVSSMNEVFKNIQKDRQSS